MYFSLGVFLCVEWNATYLKRNCLSSTKHKRNNLVKVWTVSIVRGCHWRAVKFCLVKHLDMTLGNAALRRSKAFRLLITGKLRVKRQLGHLVYIKSYLDDTELTFSCGQNNTSLVLETRKFSKKYRSWVNHTVPHLTT